MTMKQILLATTALAVASAMAVPAMADGGQRPPPPEERYTPPPKPQPPKPQPPLRGSYDDCLGGSTCDGGRGSGWYISVLGGGNWADGQENYRFAANPTGPGSALVPDAFYAYQDHQADTGFVVGAAVGRDLCCWVPGLRGEVELTYRRNKITGFHEDGTDNLASTAQVPDVTGPLDGTISSFAIMANVWYDIDLGGFNPYFGGGIGWGRSQFKVNYFDTTFSDQHGSVDEKDSGFAYQLGAGFNIPIGQGTRLGVGYRFVDLGEMEFRMPGTAQGGVPWVNGLVNGVTFDQQYHSAVANLTFDID